MVLALGWGQPLQAFFGLGLGDHRVFFFEPALSEQEGELDAHLDAESPELEFEDLKGTSLGAGYGFSVHSIGEGLKARWDRYRLRAELGPGIWKIFNKTMRFGFGIEAGSEIKFLRHFTEAKKAALALPLEPWVLGSVDSILEHLSPGDLASLPVRGDILLRAGIKTPLLGVPVKPSVFFRFGGNFQIDLLRLRGSKVRVRFLSLRHKQYGAAIKAGLGWDATLLELLGKEVKVMVDFDLAKSSWIKKWGDGVMLDATLDLADPRAREVFEKLFYKPVSLMTKKDSLLSVGWPMLQDLAKEVALENDPTREPAAEIHQCGLMKFQQDSWKMKLGAIVWRWGRKDLTTTVEFEPQKKPSEAEPGKTMVVASNLSVGKKTFFFRREGKWFHRSRVFAHKEGDRYQLGLWSMGYRVKDRHFSNRDRRDFQTKVKRFLGPRHAYTVPTNQSGDKIKAKGDIRFRFSRESLEKIAAMSVEEFDSKWNNWLDVIDPGFLWKTNHVFSVGSLAEDFLTTLRDALEGKSIESIRNLARFRKANRAFADLGPGFLMHLTHPEVESRVASLYSRYKDSAKQKILVERGQVENAASESLLPFIYFLTTGISQSQLEAHEEAIQARLEMVANQEAQSETQANSEDPQANTLDLRGASPNSGVYQGEIMTFPAQEETSELY